MHRFITLLIVIIPFISCQEDQPLIQRNRNQNLSQAQIDSVLTEFVFLYEEPIIPDSSQHILIPVSTRIMDKRISITKDGYYARSYPRYWNVLFYNPTTMDTRLLTQEKVRISVIDVAGNKDYTQEKTTRLPHKVLYTISDQDYNNDGQLDGKDPHFLFVSGMDGRNFMRVSPPHEHLLYYEVLKGNKVRSS
ncbi:hypothetical protein AB9P05_05025 [Roseivirga sp. BDSF3-8]|uniref:hypothetical protein n=1 Tax=Roseivirga sp. BDSF3-8 TaxID=3241598 RepID=UPI0035322F1A